jgi:coproporphyrinogen III oxidase-like Fe-S oxidoreductase
MSFKEILVDDFENKIKDYIDNNLIEINDNILKLTDNGMNVYNGIVTDLIKEF